VGKRAQSRDSYMKRIEQEDQQKGMTEKEVMDMELLEMALIKKLQTAQVIQKQAYEELETISRN
jgi:hypothetical protein